MQVLKQLLWLFVIRNDECSLLPSLFCAWWTHGCLALGYKWAALRWPRTRGGEAVSSRCPCNCDVFHLTSGPVLSMIVCGSQVLPSWIGNCLLNLNYSLPQSCEFRLMWDKATWCSPTLQCKWECIASAHSTWIYLIPSLLVTPTPVSPLWCSKSTSTGPW